MPRSKHRRKPGGKSVRHPGRGKAPKPLPLDAEAEAYRQMIHAVAAPFHEQTGYDAPAGYLLDLALDEFWVRPSISRIAITSHFLQSVEDEDGTMLCYKPEEAEAAWAALIADEFVVLDGDTVSLHPRIAQHFAAAPAMGAQRSDQSA